MRKKHDEVFKAKVALEASREGAKINEVASKYQVHPGQVSAWKKQLLQNVAGIFANKESKEDPGVAKKGRRVFKGLGREGHGHKFSKKKFEEIESSVRRSLIDRYDEKYSITRQCRLLGISKSTLYYEKRP